MSNIHSLSLSNPRSEKKADQEEFFGGGATSGTAVWRPTNGPQREQPPPHTQQQHPETDLRQIIQQARNQGSSSSSSSSSSAAAASTTTAACVLTIYSNGFIVGKEGEFRDAKDKQNQSFIDSLKRGEVPQELEALIRSEGGITGEDSQVQINLVDKSNEVFVPSKPKFNFAASKGQKLTDTTDTHTHSTSTVNSRTIQPQLYVADPSQPTTTLQLVLSDRTKTRHTFNVSTTIRQLYAHVNALTQRGASDSVSAFELVSGFPPRPLTRMEQTLKEAQLLGASITQQNTNKA